MTLERNPNSLKGRYAKLETDRLPFLNRARECSELTIPSLLPPQGATSSTRLPTPYQSIGARGVNNLASKLLLTQLPPNTPFFQYKIDDFMLKQMTGQDGMRAEVEKGLSSMERSIMNEIETTNVRAPAFESLKLLLVTGNSLEYLPDDGGMKVYRMDRYVCKRDPMGNLLELIVKESISPMEMPEEVRKVVGRDEKREGEKLDAEDSHDLYTCVRRTLTNWEVWQEVEDVEVPGSRGSYPLDKNPWRALRLIAMDGEDYGRGFVEEYLGDLKSLEGLSKALLEGTAMAAKVLFLTRPNASTKASDLAKAKNGDFVTGNRDDVAALQVDKFADFRVAADRIEKLETSLAFAFLLNTAIQRNGERVTAEEIRYMAQELETSLGGVYSRLSQEWQLPFVVVIAHRMERQGRLPKLPKGVVKPAVVTGIEAIGRGNDLTKLSGFLQDISPLGPEVVAQNLNARDFIKRAATARGIDADGLILTEDQVAANTQQAQLQQLVSQLGPNAVTQLGGLAKQGMVNNQQPQGTDNG